MKERTGANITDNLKGEKASTSSNFPSTNENVNLFMRALICDPVFDFAFGLGSLGDRELTENEKAEKDFIDGFKKIDNKNEQENTRETTKSEDITNEQSAELTKGFIKTESERKLEDNKVLNRNAGGNQNTACDDNSAEIAQIENNTISCSNEHNCDTCGCSKLNEKGVGRYKADEFYRTDEHEHEYSNNANGNLNSDEVVNNNGICDKDENLLNSAENSAQQATFNDAESYSTADDVDQAELERTNFEMYTYDVDELYYDDNAQFITEQNCENSTVMDNAHNDDQVEPQHNQLESATQYFTPLTGDDDVDDYEDYCYYQAYIDEPNSNYNAENEFYEEDNEYYDDYVDESEWVENFEATNEQQFQYHAYNDDAETTSNNNNEHKFEHVHNIDNAHQETAQKYTQNQTNDIDANDMEMDCYNQFHETTTNLKDNENDDKTYYKIHEDNAQQHSENSSSTVDTKIECEKNEGEMESPHNQLATDTEFYTPDAYEDNDFYHDYVDEPNWNYNAENALYEENEYYDEYIDEPEWVENFENVGEQQFQYHSTNDEAENTGSIAYDLNNDYTYVDDDYNDNYIDEPNNWQDNAQQNIQENHIQTNDVHTNDDDKVDVDVNVDAIDQLECNSQYYETITSDNDNDYDANDDVYEDEDYVDEPNWDDDTQEQSQNQTINNATQQYQQQDDNDFNISDFYNESDFYVNDDSRSSYDVTQNYDNFEYYNGMTIEEAAKYILQSPSKTTKNIKKSNQ